MAIRFCIYRWLGRCREVVWTAVTKKGLVKQKDWRRWGHRYLWMLPIHGLLAPVGEPIHNALRRHFWLPRRLAYLIGIWAIDCITRGLLRWLTGKFPWKYSHLGGNIDGVIALEYAPIWFGFGLGFERAHDFLVGLEPAVRTALTG